MTSGATPSWLMTTMKTRLCYLILVAARVLAHGDHTFDLDDKDDESMPYAERHVS